MRRCGNTNIAEFTGACPRCGEKFRAYPHEVDNVVENLDVNSTKPKYSKQTCTQCNSDELVLILNKG